MAIIHFSDVLLHDTFIFGMNPENFTEPIDHSIRPRPARQRKVR